MSTQPRELHPNRRVFIFRSMFRAAIFTFPLVLLAVAAAPAIDVGAGVGLVSGIATWLVLVGLRFVERRIVFAKTRYLIHADRIVLETGGLLSDRSVDLQFANVTRAVLTLPFIEHRLYETGHVVVQAAGSAAAEMVLESIDEPAAVFESISDSLRANGFSLARQNMIQQERPGLVGSLYELGAPIVTSAVVLVFVIPDMLQGVLLASGSETVEELLKSVATGDVISEQAVQLTMWSLAAGALLVAGAAAFFIGLLVLKWLDILKRTYTLHDDVIDYTDGFLTKHHSFIPIENLTDVEIEEKLVQRALSISTIKVSCQGAGVDIRLAAVPNGKQFKANLETLIDASAGPAAEAGTTTTTVSDAASTPAEHAAILESEAVNPPTERLPRVEGKYDYKRGVAGPAATAVVLAVGVAAPSAIFALTMPEVGLPILGFALLFAGAGLVSGIVKTAIQTYALRYAVDDRKVTHTYDLLSRKQTEFTVDKISAVEIRRSPIDRWFGCAKVAFTSIGSTEKIKFENLANADTVISAVLARMGIDANALQRQETPRHGLAAQVRAVDAVSVPCALSFLGGLGALAVLAEAGVGIMLASILALVGRTIYLQMFCSRASLDIGENWIRTRTGILIKTELYIPAHHVRGIDARRILSEERGLLTVRSGGGATGTLAYLDDVWALQDSLDHWLHQSATGQPLDTQEVDNRSPAVLNAIVRLVVVSVLTVVLAPLLIFTIPWVVVATRRTRYVLAGSRIEKTSGVLRRRRDTILLARIDHLTTQRGALNRLNSTGSIGVRTLGSGGTDMLVRDVPDHQGFYERTETLTKQPAGR